jgi:hypothetical protein
MGSNFTDFFRGIANGQEPHNWQIELDAEDEQTEE